MSTNPNTTKTHDGRPAKKPYEKPQIFVYGDIREITQNVGNRGKGDGGATSGMKKSQV